MPPERPRLRRQYTQGQTSFDVGDIMLMYTDGLIERRGEDLTERHSPCRRTIAGMAARRAARLPLRQIDQDVPTPAEPQLDDMCVLAVSRPGPDRAQGEAS